MHWSKIEEWNTEEVIYYLFYRTVTANTIYLIKYNRYYEYTVLWENFVKFSYFRVGLGI